MTREPTYKQNYPDLLREAFDKNPEYLGNYEEIASIFNVTRMTVYLWRNEYPDFAAACDEVRDLAADRAERGMYLLAEGPVIVKTIEKPNGEIITETTRAAPDFRALKFILTNRRPDEWKDKTDVAVSGEACSPIILFADEITPEQKRALEMKNNGRQIIQFDEQDAGVL